MVAFDTNVVVRPLLRDDAAQARRPSPPFFGTLAGRGYFCRSWPNVGRTDALSTPAATSRASRRFFPRNVGDDARTKDPQRTASPTDPYPVCPAVSAILHSMTRIFGVSS